MLQFDNRNNLIIIFVILALVLFFTQGVDIKETIFSLPGLIIALTLHEFAHAWMAVKLGDTTPQAQGRLNINPMSHMDPVGTICLLFGGFGWGKPVQINPNNFKRPEKDSAKVAFAGPAMNLILSVLSAVLYAVFFIIGYKTNGVYVTNDGAFEFNTVWRTILTVIEYSMILNLWLAIFNLLPFPPLDGSKIYRAFARGKLKKILYDLENYSMIIIMILFITHIAQYIITPIVGAILNYVLFPIINGILHLAG